MNEAIWTDGCEGTVSLTFDDAHPSQLERAIPVLEAHGLRGTFYVNPTDAWRERSGPWRDAALRGHEIGNHTLRHPCSRNFSFTPPDGGLERMSLEEIEADILEAERRLNDAIPEQNVRSFCYPCYQCEVGEGTNRQSYVPVVARHFPAGRGRGETANHPARIDLHYLGSFPAERCSGAEMIGLVETAVASGLWAILTFHGIQEGHLMVGAGDFEELCRHLARHRPRIRTAPVVEIAQTLHAWRASKASTDEHR